MQRKTLARWLVVTALACWTVLGGGALVSAETTVQGSQSSEAATSNSGTSAGSSNSDFQSGPSATGDSGASSSQLGSNDASVSQSGSSKAGDSVAGAQVTGAVADDVTVQNQNSASGAVATTGGATLTNNANVATGPEAIVSGAGTFPANASQIGDNSVDIAQSGTSATGDAVAGSQVTGIVGDGEHTVQNQNTVVDAATATALGDAVTANSAVTSAGPYAESVEEAQAAQVGDNDAVISQSSDASSGDALAGSQVTGVVGGSATVQGQNSSGVSTAVSGSAVSSNTIDPAANFSLAGPIALTGQGGTAQATQNGDNAVDVAQAATGASGDAVAGSQVVGAVGDSDGFLTVQNQQAGDVSTGVSGPTTVINEFSGDAGPQAFEFTGFAGTAEASQIGDNAVAVAQALDAFSGDALGGAQVTGDVGHTDVTVQNQNDPGLAVAVSGPVTAAQLAGSTFVGPFADATDSAQAGQIGDNAFVVDQSLEAASGDAVAAGQVTGIVAPDGANIDVQQQNTSDVPTAVSGPVTANQAVDGRVGPVAGSFADPDTAEASQNGDNEVAIAQLVGASSGDAVAGSQVAGVVAGDGSTIDIQNQNDAASLTGNTAVSGPVTVGNGVTSSALGGPFGVGPLALTDGDAQSSQLGDNAATVAQAIEASSGDALDGAQVVGLIAGDGSDATVQGQNTATGTTAVTGPVTAFNSLDEAGVAVGATAVGAEAQSTQNGDNAADVAQAIDASSGDAVSGGQITGAVLGDNSSLDVQNQNDCVACTAVTGPVTALNEADLVVAPAAFADDGDAQASLIGDNSAVVDQVVDAASGDAVAGSQVTGVVAGEGSDVNVQNQNVALAPQAVSGGVTAANTLEANLGVGAFANGGDALAEQIGDTAITYAQDVGVSTGDAVSGSQVTGIVGPEDATTQVQNDATVPVAVSGVGFGTNDAGGSLAAFAGSDGDSLANTNGDTWFDGAQDLGIESGDAVAGAQISGDVGGLV